PGEVSSQVIEIENTHENRYFSFASMIIPSNDAFVANRDSRRYELFDTSGNFFGARQITIYGRDILDAGTEVNDPAGGAAFSTGGGTSVDENGLIRQHEGLDDFIGTGLPTGETLRSAFSSLTPIATITISLVDPEASVCSGVLGACSSRSVSLQNSVLNADVNRDGTVSPLDALLVVNFLGRFGNTATLADEAQATGLALDVEGDEFISPIDALTVINEISRRISGSSGEGEQTLRFDQAIESFNFAGSSSLDATDEEDGFGLFEDFGLF
ncbi:MAG: spondin domain-containing protein, partial [Planctomycetota bacterium]